MKEYEIKYVDVFTTQKFRGSSVGVITGADGLSISDMDAISKESNLSESTFVTAPDSGASLGRVRFFTPETEYDFSGHAMIGTCHTLAEEGRIPLRDGITQVTFETNVGKVPVEFHFEESAGDGQSSAGAGGIRISGKYNGVIKKIMIHRSVMEYATASASAAVIAEPLGLDPHLITSTGLPLEMISNGLRQLVVPLQNNAALIGMQPDLIKLKLLIDRLDVHTVDIFTLDALEDEALLYSRHLSPGSGWWEDPGSGAGALSIANYLLRHGVIHPGSYVMQQGRELDELCTVHVEIREDDVSSDSAWLGGVAVTSISRSLSMDEKTVTIS